MAEVWINTGEPETISREAIAKVEALRNCVYVADLCLGTKSGGWTDSPVAVFWQETPADPSYSNYFGLFRRDGALLITGAGSVEGPWDGVIADSGEIIFSRFRHDYRVTGDETGMVDGGRDYFKHYGTPVTLRLLGPRFELVPIDGDEAAKAA